MQARYVLASLCVVALAACSPPGNRSDAGAEPAAQVTLPETAPVARPTPEAATGASYREQVMALNERQRTVVLLQSVRATGEPCEQIVSAEYVGTENRLARFIVDCRRASQWLVTIGDTDTAGLVELSPVRQVRGVALDGGT